MLFARIMTMQFQTKIEKVGWASCMSRRSELQILEWPNFTLRCKQLISTSTFTVPAKNHEKEKFKKKIC